MTGSWTPRVTPLLARRLLEQLGAEPAFLGQVFVDYRTQVYAAMMGAPDDQLAGYRGMLLAIDALAEALSRPALQKVIDKHG